MNAAPGGLILLYHRVATLDTDPQLLAVSPKNFAAQMAVLRELARPASLASIANGDAAAGSVAVTFDDGYEDNLTHAAPVLQILRIPATVFVATSGVPQAGEFFWDELDRIFLQPNRLPPSLKLHLDGSTHVIETGGDYPLAEWQRHRSWDVTASEDPTPRQRAYRLVCTLVHRATTAERYRAIARIRQWAGLGVSARPTHRMMTADQLRDLSRGGLIDIGAHTVTHPLLSIESPDVQRTEIVQSKSTLESILDRPVTTFSYPFGTRRDYTAETVRIVADAGFEFACSNFAGQIWPGQHRFQLPRVLVRNWPAGEFRERLLRWMAQPAAKETRPARA